MPFVLFHQGAAPVRAAENAGRFRTDQALWGMNMQQAEFDARQSQQAFANQMAVQDRERAARESAEQQAAARQQQAYQQQQAAARPSQAALQDQRYSRMGELQSQRLASAESRAAADREARIKMNADDNAAAMARVEMQLQQPGGGLNPQAKQRYVMAKDGHTATMRQLETRYRSAANIIAQSVFEDERKAAKQEMDNVGAAMEAEQKRFADEVKGVEAMFMPSAPAAPSQQPQDMRPAVPSFLPDPRRQSPPTSPTANPSQQPKLPDPPQIVKEEVLRKWHGKMMSENLSREQAIMGAAEEIKFRGYNPYY